MEIVVPLSKSLKSIFYFKIFKLGKVLFRSVKIFISLKLFINV
jgi:hypothetical protein